MFKNAFVLASRSAACSSALGYGVQLRPGRQRGEDPGGLSRIQADGSRFVSLLTQKLLSARAAAEPRMTQGRRPGRASNWAAEIGLVTGGSGYRLVEQGAAVQGRGAPRTKAPSERGRGRRCRGTTAFPRLCRPYRAGFCGATAFPRLSRGVKASRSASDANAIRRGRRSG